MTGVYIGQLIKHLCDNAYEDLKRLVDELSGSQDASSENGKNKLCSYISQTKYQFVKLYVLLAWAKSNLILYEKVKAQTSLYHGIQESVFHLGQAFRSGANLLHITRAPAYDVETAIEVLATGTYLRLPRKIIHFSPEHYRHDTPSHEIALERKDVIEKIEELILSRLMKSELPPQYSVFEVADAKLSCAVQHEFLVVLTLSGLKESSPWRILNLKFLVGSEANDDLHSHVKSNSASDITLPCKRQRHGQNESKYATEPGDKYAQYLMNLLQYKLMDSDSPFKDIYELLHGFVVQFTLFALKAQASDLQNSFWSGDLSVKQTGSSLLVRHWSNRYSFKVFEEDTSSGSRLSLELQPSIPNDLSLVISASTTKSMIPHRNLKLGLGIKQQPALSQENHNTKITGLLPSTLNFENLLSDILHAQAYVKLRDLANSLADEIKNCNSQTKHSMKLSICIQHFDNDHEQLLLEFPTEETVSVSVDIRSGNFILALSRKTPTDPETRSSLLSRKWGALEDRELLQSAQNKINSKEKVQGSAKELLAYLRIVNIELLLDRLDEISFNLKIPSLRSNPLHHIKEKRISTSSTREYFMKLATLDHVEYWLSIALDSNFNEESPHIEIISAVRNSANASQDPEILRLTLETDLLRNGKLEFESLHDDCIEACRKLHVKWIAKLLKHKETRIMVHERHVPKPLIMISIDQENEIAIAKLNSKLGMALYILARDLGLKELTLKIQPDLTFGYDVILESDGRNTFGLNDDSDFHGLQGRIKTAMDSVLSIEYNNRNNGIWLHTDNAFAGIDIIEKDLLAITCMRLFTKSFGTEQVETLLGKSSVKANIHGVTNVELKRSEDNIYPWHCLVFFDSKKEQFHVELNPYTIWCESLEYFLNMCFHLSSRRTRREKYALLFAQTLVDGVPVLSFLNKTMMPKAGCTLQSSKKTEPHEEPKSAAPVGKFRGKVGLSKTIEAQKASSERGATGLSLVALSCTSLRLLVGESQNIDLRLSNGFIYVKGRGTKWENAEKVFSKEAIDSEDLGYKLSFSDLEKLMYQILDALFS